MRRARMKSQPRPRAESAGGVRPLLCDIEEDGEVRTLLGMWFSEVVVVVVVVLLRGEGKRLSFSSASRGQNKTQWPWQRSREGRYDRDFS